MKSDETTNDALKTGARPIGMYVVLAAVLYALIQVYSLLSPILLSLLLIILITLAVNPIIAHMQKWFGGRKRATAFALLGVMSLGALLVWSLVVPLKGSVSTLSEKLPAYWERLQKPLIKMEQQAVLTEEKLQGEVSAEIARESSEPAKPVESKAAQKSTKQDKARSPTSEGRSPTTNGEGSLRSGLVNLIQGIFGQIKGVAQNTTNMLIVFVTVFFGVTFSLANPRPIFCALYSVVPEHHHGRTLAIMIRIAQFVPRWAGSVLISMLTIGSLFFLLMWPIFGFVDAIMLGLIACLLSAVPFLGPILTLIPALLLAIGQGGMTPIWVILAYCAVQALESNVVIPLVLSRGMKLHPLAVIFAMLLSIVAFGVLGVLIAAPLVAIAGIIHEEIYRKKFLPTVTDEGLDRLARSSLLDKC